MRISRSALTLAAVVALSCGREGAPSRDPSEFNVLVVVLDSLRADKLGCYGFARPTSPTLDALADHEDTVVYTRHHAAATWTKPSTASLFTGLFPFQHGVELGHDPKERKARRYRTQVLDDDHNTLAERMKEAGFYTLGVVKSHHLVKDYGFAQGFDVYLDPLDVRGDDKLVEATLEEIADADGRFFGYLHLQAVHYPWPDDLRDPAYMTEFGFEYDEAARRAAGVDFTTAAIKDAIRDGRLELDSGDVDFLHLIYEASLRKMDRDLVGTLIDGLKDAGVFDSTLLIVTADHGEELYDHRSFAHGHALWQEVIQVPMIAKFPRGRKPAELPDRVNDVTSAIDIAPSLLQLAGTPANDLPGSSMFDGRFGQLAFAELRRNYALLRDGFKVVSSRDGDMLFDLRSDAAERTDLLGVNSEKVAELNALAEALKAAAKGNRTEAPTIDTQLDATAVEDLRQLGYIR